MSNSHTHAARKLPTPDGDLRRLVQSGQQRQVFDEVSFARLQRQKVGDDPLTHDLVLDLASGLERQTRPERRLVAQEKRVHALVALQHKVQNVLGSVDVPVVAGGLVQEAEEDDWVAQQEVKLVPLCASQAMEVGLIVRKLGHQLP